MVDPGTRPQFKDAATQVGESDLGSTSTRVDSKWHVWLALKVPAGVAALASYPAIMQQLRDLAFMDVFKDKPTTSKQADARLLKILAGVLACAAGASTGAVLELVAGLLLKTTRYLIRLIYAIVRSVVRLVVIAVRLGLTGTQQLYRLLGLASKFITRLWLRATGSNLCEPQKTDDGYYDGGSTSKKFGQCGLSDCGMRWVDDGSVKAEILDRGDGLQGGKSGILKAHPVSMDASDCESPTSMQLLAGQQNGVGSDGIVDNCMSRGLMESAQVLEPGLSENKEDGGGRVREKGRLFEGAGSRVQARSENLWLAGGYPAADFDVLARAFILFADMKGP